MPTETSNAFISNRMIQLVVLIFAACLCDFMMLRYFEYPWTLVSTDICTLAGFLILFMILSQTIQKNYHTRVALNLSNVSMLLLFTLISVFGNYLIGASAFEWNQKYVHFLKEFLVFKFIVVALVLTVSSLLFWITQQKRRDALVQNYAVKKERESLQIELNNLQQQLKPHFLFNSLNSINALTLSNPEEARKMIHLLSEFMRGSIRSDRNNFTTLELEIQQLKLYSDIEKVRFGDRLRVEYTITEEALSAKIPALILQPLMENSIKYGLYGHTDGVRIEIAASRDPLYLFVTIKNPYDETSSGGEKGTGYGLKSVERKMELIYDQSGLLSTDTANDVFTVTLKIPQP